MAIPTMKRKRNLLTANNRIKDRMPAGNRRLAKKSWF